MVTINTPCVQAKDNCWAFDSGRCTVLTDTRFKRECPFYKTEPPRADEEDA